MSIRLHLLILQLKCYFGKHEFQQVIHPISLQYKGRICSVCGKKEMIIERVK